MEGIEGLASSRVLNIFETSRETMERSSALRLLPTNRFHLRTKCLRISGSIRAEIDSGDSLVDMADMNDAECTDLDKRVTLL